MAINNNKMSKRLGTSLGKIFGEDVIKRQEEVTTENLNNENRNNDEIQINLDATNSNSTSTFSPTLKIDADEPKVNVQPISGVKPINDVIKKVISSDDIEENENTNDQEISNEKKGKPYMVNINLVQPNKDQPRKNFDEDRINELSQSILKYGVITPLIVKRMGSYYEIVAGERRWRAARIAGLNEVPIIIKEYDEKTTKEIAIIENIQREDLNAVEEALAYQNLIDEYGLTQEEVAKRVSKNRATITNSLRILKLNDTIKELIKNGKLTSGHARALLSIENEELREKIANRVIEEKLTVRDIEKLVRLNDLSKYRDDQRKEENRDHTKQLKAIYKDLEKKLKTKLNTKVRIIARSEDKGKIEIEYYTKEELDRLYLLLNNIE
ncbi:MAG: ParB/RepB/Spo0J family partition protein [Eubacteriales bacterium]|nr:ParB/RepB/Spo0J family partition protein [Eubacteriales bacterium]